jgi:hypothetical protein
MRMPTFVTLFYALIGRQMKNRDILLVLFISCLLAFESDINPAYWLYDALTHTQRFHGVACSNDCSGHKAGFAWAAASGEDGIDVCENSPKSFQEGCKIYFRELAGPSD